jgi:hypothetical protein
MVNKLLKFLTPASESARVRGKTVNGDDMHVIASRRIKDRIYVPEVKNQVPSYS